MGKGFFFGRLGWDESVFVVVVVVVVMCLLVDVI